jgi:hypothetical protein
MYFFHRKKKASTFIAKAGAEKTLHYGTAWKACEEKLTALYLCEGCLRSFVVKQSLTPRRMFPVTSGFLASGSSYSQLLLTVSHPIRISTWRRIQSAWPKKSKDVSLQCILLLSSPVTVAGPLRLDRIPKMQPY